MKTSGFTLCDDLMEKVGERVEAKRKQDTMDYWCGHPSPRDFLYREKREMLKTMDKLIKRYRPDLELSLDEDIREDWMGDLEQTPMMASLESSVYDDLRLYVNWNIFDEKKMKAFDDPKFWALSGRFRCMVVPAFVKGVRRCGSDFTFIRGFAPALGYAHTYPVTRPTIGDEDFHGECVSYEMQLRHELEEAQDALNVEEDAEAYAAVAAERAAERVSERERDERDRAAADERREQRELNASLSKALKAEERAEEMAAEEAECRRTAAAMFSEDQLGLLYLLWQIGVPVKSVKFRKNE
jgi:hypothetical protein